MTQSNEPDPELGPAVTPPPPNFPAATPPPLVEYAPAGYPGPYAGPAPDQSPRTMGMLSHLLALSGLIIPFGNLIGPLVLWLLKKQEHPFIDDQGKESLNFQITVLIAAIILSPTLCFGIGFVILPLVGILGLVFAVIGAIKANGGEAYRYPWALRLIK